MRTADAQVLEQDLEASYATFITTLAVGTVSAGARQANYIAIKAKLEALRISVEGSNVAHAAGIIGRYREPHLSIQTEKPLPAFDAGKALLAITAEYGHHATIDGVEIYLDKDQLPHQPLNHRIGTRPAAGKRRFKNTLASALWHEANTMTVMAIWANSLPASALANGRKEFLGPSEDHHGISYEAFCQMINGTRYVSYHCYPAPGVMGDRLACR